MLQYYNTCTCIQALVNFQLHSSILSVIHMCIYLCTCVGVTNIIAEVTNTAIAVVWDPAVAPSDCGPVLYYIVTATSLADASDRNTKRTNQTRAEFSNLLNNANYNISVVAVNRVCTGPSSMITVTTLTGNEGK